jgi:hypothetical protein
MTMKTHRVVTATTVLTTALTLGSVGPASAEAPRPVDSAETDYEAGVACAFPLRVSSTEGRIRENEFVDRSGNVVRTIQVTTGIAYTNTNLLTGKSITVDPRGSAMHTTVKDGVATVTSNGQTGLIMFPTDVPAGPSTTVYRGRVVFTIDLTTGVFTLVSTTGTSVDICAALA